MDVVDEFYPTLIKILASRESMIKVKLFSNQRQRNLVNAGLRLADALLMRKTIILVLTLFSPIITVLSLFLGLDCLTDC